MTRKISEYRGRKAAALSSWTLATVLLLTLFCLSMEPRVTTVQASEGSCFLAELNLTSLDGTNGFAINGEAETGRSGWSLSYAGDVNGDGIADTIIGAYHAEPNGKINAGTSYVVFGKNTAESTSFPSELELSSLDGTNGFAINGEAEKDYSGISVSHAGDVNADGIDDIIIGAYHADPNGNDRAGKSYVVFGKNTSESTSFPSELDLSSLDGTNGFAVNGEAQDDKSGNSVSYAGDVNGDAIDDIIIGAYGADASTGKSYVVFGKDTSESTSFPSELELSSLDGSNGFAINGEADGDWSGYSVSLVGDINGDDIDDIIIGASHAAPNGKLDAGTSYVVFGRNTAESTSFPPEFELSSLDGTNGFAINGEADDDRSGISVSYAGDVNGDNVNEITIGAQYADPNGNDRAGKSYVVFGKNTAESTNFPSVLELSSLDGTNGFAIHGDTENDESGYSVSFAGDLNHDGIGDIIIGARYADPNGIYRAGTSYVVFGRNTSESSSFPSELELSSLDGTNGLAINGEAYSDRSGISVSSPGDANGDNIDDIIIGAYAAAPNGISGAGTSYVVHGRDTSGSTTFPSVLELSSLNGTIGFAINGEADGDGSGFSVSYAGDMNGDNIGDIIIGAIYADPNGKDKAGKSYVVFGIDCTPDTNSPTSIPTPVPAAIQPTRSPANEPAAQTAILSLLFETPFVEATHDSKAFKDAICEVVSTVTGLQCGENLKVLSVQGTTSSEGEEALLLSFEIPKGSIDVDKLDELAAEINSEISSSDDEDVQNLPPVDEISYDDDSSSSSLSTEAIVGIAIGSVIAMTALFAVGYKTLNRQHSTSATKGFLGRTKHRNFARKSLQKCSRGVSSAWSKVPNMKLSTYPPSHPVKKQVAQSAPRRSGMPEKVYAVFLTHHKQDGGETARTVKSELEKRFEKMRMKPYRCFLDVDEYLDLNNLREEVEKSEVLCVLQTKEVNTRPWCLLELGTAIDNNIPIVALNLQGRGYEFATQEEALGNLRETLETRNPGAVEVLEKCGIDVDELGKKLAHHIPKIISLPFDPVFWSKKPQAATFDTLVERIQQAKRKSVASVRAKKNDEAHMSLNVDTEAGNSTAN